MWDASVGVSRFSKSPAAEADSLACFAVPSDLLTPVPIHDVTAGERLTVRLRYKEPDAEESRLLNVPLSDESRPFDQAGEDFRFAAAVAEFGLLLRQSPHKGEADFDHVIQTARSSLGPDEHGYRAEFVELAEKAKQLSGGIP